MNKQEEYIIEIRNVSKLYGNDRESAVSLLREGRSKEEVQNLTGVSTALWDVNLKIPKGKIFVIIGKSGSGKSTLVRCLNRLIKPTEGQILYKGADIEKLSKEELRELRRTQVSMVFQSFGLMSHRDVLGNVAFGLEIRGVPKEEREAKAMEIISMVGLQGWEHESCESLSGGMRQRVGIARALANDPEILLMDEPFSALDPLVRQEMQFELMKIQRKLHKTIIFITHDMDEAFFLGDNVAIMRGGQIVQTATPLEMSKNPADEYVKSFISNADKSKVITVKDIMVTPKSIVKLTDSMDFAIHVMIRQALSSVFVVDEELSLAGVLTIHNALKGNKEHKNIGDMVDTNVNTVRMDALLTDVMDVAVDTVYPLVVTDNDGKICGILPKANVLASLI